MAVDIGSAVGYLDLDISGFSTGLKTAQSEASKAGKNIESSLGGKLESVGSKMSAIGGIATAGITVPIATAVTASVKQFAKLEQSIGGIETMFKKTAPTVIKNAESAYKRAGISANDYMEQVTSFSASLLSSLGGDTVKAANYADRAIVDMSDNANKMGTSMETIVQTYQSLAKGNYAMLDNLKLGYGGTKTEMERMIADANRVKEANGEMGDLSIESFADVTEAIHIMQTELGITGTTAKEAEGTVAGSFAMMKASVLNFLQQLGNPGAEMDKFTQAMLDSIGIFLDNVKRVLGTIWDNLPLSGLQKSLLVAAAAFGPVMLAGGKVVSTVGKITTAVGTAIPKIKSFAEGFKLAKAGFPMFAAEASKTGAVIGGLATGPMVAIVAAIALVVAAFVSLWKNNEEFRNKITAIWDQIKATFEKLTSGIVERLNKLGFDFKNIGEVLKAIWKGFCDFLAPVFEGVFNNIAIVFETFVNVFLGVWDFFHALFTGDWEGCWDAVKSVFESIWNGISSWFSNILNVIKGVFDVVLGWFGTSWSECWNSIKTFFTNIWTNISNWFKTTLNSIVTFFTNTWTSVSTFFSNLWNGIVSFLQNAWNTIKNVVQTGIMFIVELLNAAFQLITLPFRFIWENCKETIISIWNSIKTTISNALTAIQTTISNIWNAVKTFFTTVWNSIKTFITTVWNGIKTTITTVINAISSVISSVFNAIKTTITNIWNSIKTTITNVVNSVKTTVTNVFNAIKTTTTNVWNGIKTAITTPLNAAKTTITNVVNSVKSTISSGFNAAKSTVTSIFNSIKNSITNVMNSAKTAVSNAISNIKSKFNFSWSLPKLKMPHVSISGKFSINPPSVPKFSISWYKKAMGNGMILNSPTIFGFDQKTGKFLGGGEAGSETVVGTKSLLSMIRQAVNDAIAPLVAASREVARTSAELGYVTYNGFTKLKEVKEGQSTSGKRDSGNGDTFIFNSPKAIDEIEAAKQLKKTKRELAEGF